MITTWADWLAVTTAADRLAWCRAKAKGQRRRHPSTLTGHDVLGVLMAAQGRCSCCGSLAVNRLPKPGQPRGEHVDRLVGSLEHVVPLERGGTNGVSNLAWSCLWCNTCYHGDPVRRIVRSMRHCTPGSVTR